MTVLAVLTVVYAAVFVLVLAFTLIAILVHLVRINRALEQTRASLLRVAAATGGIEEPLAGVWQAVNDTGTDFESAAAALQDAEDRAAALAPSAEASGNR